MRKIISEKILAIQFKYFGDAVLMTPALRALRDYFPQAELHVLLPEESAPLLHHLPWVTRVWPMVRRRGRVGQREAWSLVRALRRERFHRSVDFASNDRGAMISWLVGAHQRLGWDDSNGFLGRRWCYTQRVAPQTTAQYEAARLAGLLSGWHVDPPDSFDLALHTDPTLANVAAGLLPDSVVVCHLAASQPNRQWPVQRWAALYQLATAADIPVVFTTPTGARERALADALRALLPTVPFLPALPLAQFVAVLSRARVLVVGDTGPLHFAAGLGVPTLALFGPSDPRRFAPIGKKHRFLQAASPCGCGPGERVCAQTDFCLDTITAEQVLATLRTMI